MQRLIRPLLGCAAVLLLAGCYGTSDDVAYDSGRYDVEFDRAYTHTYPVYPDSTVETTVVRTEPVAHRAGHWDVVTHPDGTTERVWVEDHPAGHWDTLTHPDGTTERVWVPAH